MDSLSYHHGFIFHWYIDKLKFNLHISNAYWKSHPYFKIVIIYLHMIPLRNHNVNVNKIELIIFLQNSLSLLNLSSWDNTVIKPVFHNSVSDLEVIS